MLVFNFFIHSCSEGGAGGESVVILDVHLKGTPCTVQMWKCLLMVQFY